MSIDLLSPVELYKKKKAELQASLMMTPRPRCIQCKKPAVTCYCPTLTPIESYPEIVILMHPLEAAHPIGTGRMTHQCLKNSKLIYGTEFTQNAEVNTLINDPNVAPMVLYPGKNSTDLSQLSSSERKSFLPANKRPVIILIDGTWHCAKKMLYRSPNLQKVPRICFTPDRLSRFRVRKQPHPHCFSTIEATHELLRLLDPAQQGSARPYDMLLSSFDAMIEKQLSFRTPSGSRHALNYKARKERERQLKMLIKNDEHPI